MANLYIFLSFFLTEYLLRTFVHAFKFHEIGLPFEFFPIFIVTVACTLLCKPIKHLRNVIKLFLILLSISLLGYISASVVLFFQWYWIISPQYRNMPGDMQEGIAWAGVFLCIGSILITIVSIVLTIAVRLRIKHNKINEEADQIISDLKDSH